MSWSTKRQLLYLVGLIALILLFVGLPTYLHFDKPATCFDQKQNQDEEGIDCGGGCASLCADKQLAPIILWSRAFRVAHGVYNVAAYVENPNEGAEALSVPYVFRIYDKGNILINEREGSTFIPAKKSFPIFEGAMSVGERTPSYTTLGFRMKPLWRRVTVKDAPLSIKSQTLSDAGDGSRIDALLVNDGVQVIKNIELVATVFGEDSNALGVSRTIVERLDKREEKQIFFTWPESFGKTVSKIEILPSVRPTQ